MVGSGDMVLVRCSTKLQSEVEVRNWFGNGRSICFRGKKNVCEPSWSLYIVPANSLYQCFLNQQQQLKQQQTLNNENNSSSSSTKKRKSCCDILFNHTLRHTFRVKFTSKTLSGINSAELYDACWVVLDSIIYFFGVGGSNEIYYLNKEDLVASPSSVGFELAGFMDRVRKAPKVVALEGKIYVFESSFCEVFKPITHCPRGRTKSLSSPLEFQNTCNVQFAVAIEKEKKIVVGISYELTDQMLVEVLYPEVEATIGTAVFVYDVVGDSWDKLKSNLFLNRKSLLCEPIAVGNCLYWFDTKLWAYDLNTKQYYEGSIEDCFFMHVIGTERISSHKVSLLHLVEDFFYMTWADLSDPYVHCTMVQAVKTTIKLQNDNCFKLRATVLSCQTFASDDDPFLKEGALIF